MRKGNDAQTEGDVRCVAMLVAVDGVGGGRMADPNSEALCIVEFDVAHEDGELIASETGDGVL